VSVTPVLGSSIPSTETATAGSTTLQAVSIEPHGTQLAQPATIQIPLTVPLSDVQGKTIIIKLFNAATQTTTVVGEGTLVSGTAKNRHISDNFIEGDITQLGTYVFEAEVNYTYTLDNPVNEHDATPVMPCQSSAITLPVSRTLFGTAPNLSVTQNAIFAGQGVVISTSIVTYNGTIQRAAVQANSWKGVFTVTWDRYTLSIDGQQVTQFSNPKSATFRQVSTGICAHQGIGGNN